MVKQPKGYLALVLHAHLPFVRHPEENYFLEENWLYEAITETYIPLIKVFESLVRDDVDFRVTMSISPTLAAMFTDSLLQGRYVRHINKLIELAEKELTRTSHDPHYHGLALMYYARFIDAREIFERYQKDLINAFKKFQESGYLEIIACCATHGYLPNLRVNESSVKAQIEIGIAQYQNHFGVAPKGMWLPECGFYPGLDSFLKEAGIEYFFCDSHGIMNADPRPQFGVYAPIYCPSGVAAFGRDWESSKQVWSSKEGYPGDADYREYYRDIGFTSDFDYIKPYIHPDGIRINTGIKYWRVTGDTEYKEPYQPQKAREKAALHARDFIFNRQEQVRHLHPQMMGRKPMIVAPYDAELFGHWWFEGPQWIDFLARQIFYDQDTVTMITPSQYLKEYSTNQVAMPSQSSWGYKGFSEFWLESSNDWIYPYLHEAGQMMKDLALKNFNLIEGDFRHNLSKSALHYRALNQAARELLLAESSDWPFIMKAGTMVAYAEKRLKGHLNRFYKLCNDLQNDCIDEAWLKEIEERDNIFWDLNCVKFYLETKKSDHVTVRKD